MIETDVRQAEEKKFAVLAIPNLVILSLVSIAYLLFTILELLLAPQALLLHMQEETDRQLNSRATNEE